MLIVDGNPLQDVRALSSVSVVLLKGERVARSTIFEQKHRRSHVVRGLRRPNDWQAPDELHRGTNAPRPQVAERPHQPNDSANESAAAAVPGQREKIVVSGFCHRDPRRDSERADDLRQRVGMSNHERISRAGFQLCDQPLEIVTWNNLGLMPNDRRDRRGRFFGAFVFSCKRR